MVPAGWPMTAPFPFRRGVLTVGVSGCGGVDDGKLEDQITQQVERQGGKVSSVDCPSGEDEDPGLCGGGGGSCSSSEYTCSDGACIPDSWVCDGYYDCSGGDDEDFCP